MSIINLKYDNRFGERGLVFAQYPKPRGYRQSVLNTISTVGTFINVGTTTPIIGLNNVATNRRYNNAIVTSYLINLTENPNIIIPKFI